MSARNHCNGTYACNVGIKGIEFYFPRKYVDQEEFAKFNGDDPNKYTKGMGLKEMGFCDDNEDVSSLALTATAMLLKNYKIDQKSIGFLVVGTESLIDKSKSVKTTLMRLFDENGDIEGVDVKNACYGGTQALLHAVDWVYSTFEYRGQDAIVVMSDIATYEAGPARCTGGAGAIAVLVGPNAPLVVDQHSRSFDMRDEYDFYKPVRGMSTEFPMVSGKLSVECYLDSLNNCYQRYLSKEKYFNKDTPSITDFHALVFHCPFYKVIQKAFTNMYYTDCKQGRIENDRANELIGSHGNLAVANKEFIELSFELLRTKVEPYVEFNQRVGNMYTASVYASLVAVLSRLEYSDEISGERVLLFSYGSGTAAAMFSLRFNLESNEQKNQLQVMISSAAAAQKRLAQRLKYSAEEYTEALLRRTALTEGVEPYSPRKGEHLFPVEKKAAIKKAESFKYSRLKIYEHLEMKKKRKSAA